MDTNKDKLQICSNFKDLSGCGKCTISLCDDTNIKELTVSSISSIVDTLMYTCANNGDKHIMINYSTLTCTGDIEFGYIKGDKANYIYENRKECSKFIRFWYKHHRYLLMDSLHVVYMSSVYDTLNNIHSQEELKERVDKIHSSFELFFSSQDNETKF